MKIPTTCIWLVAIGACPWTSGEQWPGSLPKRSDPSGHANSPWLGNYTAGGLAEYGECVGYLVGALATRRSHRQALVACSKREQPLAPLVADFGGFFLRVIARIAVEFAGAPFSTGGDRAMLFRYKPRRNRNWRSGLFRGRGGRGSAMIRQAGRRYPLTRCLRAAHGPPHGLPRRVVGACRRSPHSLPCGACPETRRQCKIKAHVQPLAR